MGSSYGSKFDDLITELQAKLESADQPLDVSSAEIDVDLNSLTYGNLPVEQQTPVGIENSVGTQIDPLSAGDQPLDVSSAKVDVDINSQTLGALTVAAHGINDTGAVQIDPSIKSNQLRELENVGTAKRIHNEGQASSVTLYTVPTGTTFYLVAYSLRQSWGGKSELALKDSSDNELWFIFMPSDGSKSEAICPPYILPAGYSITGGGDGTNTHSESVYGYEV